MSFSTRRTFYKISGWKDGGVLSPFTPDVHYPDDTNLALCVRQPQAQGARGVSGKEMVI